MKYDQKKIREIVNQLKRDLRKAAKQRRQAIEFDDWYVSVRPGACHLHVPYRIGFEFFESTYAL